MQVTLDGPVRYCGHEVIKTKDGRTFVNLSVVDEKNVPITLNFCPGHFEAPLSRAEWGQQLTLTFEVRKWNNQLTLRCTEVFV